MSLTFQPFSTVPALNELGAALARNVSIPERLVSYVVGTTLLGALASSLTRHRIARLAILAVGAALVHRGTSGHCAVYEKLGINSHGAQPASAS